MADKKRIVLFPQKLPAYMQAEGLAIHWAVLTGKCNECKHLPRCSSDDTFRMPTDAVCVVKKKEILKEWGMKDGKID